MTTLAYLANTYLFESSAIFLELRSHEKGIAVILDSTILYPQGGGQPSDHGKLTSSHGVFTVTDVRLDEHGVVWHFGSFESGEFVAGDEITIQVDQARREQHARLHSAGHLLDCAVTQLGWSQLKPTKGFHFPDGPYVEYQGEVTDGAALVPVLQETLNQLVKKNLQVITTELSFEAAKESGITAPPGKSARIVGFEGFAPCGCGGTHVRSASEIGAITVRKIKSSQGITRIAYALS